MPIVYDLTDQDTYASYKGVLSFIQYNEFDFELTMVVGRHYYFCIPRGIFSDDAPWDLVDFDNNILHKTPENYTKYGLSTWFKLNYEKGREFAQQLDAKAPIPKDPIEECRVLILQSGLSEETQGELLKQLEVQKEN